jgi:hypothetical protein
MALTPLEQASAQAWRGALELLRANGKDPSEVVQAAARNANAWQKRQSTEGEDDELDPDEA